MTRSDLHKGFPFTAKLDLSPLVGLWREQAADSESLWSAHASNVLQQAQSIPELNGPVDDPERLRPHARGVESLMSAFRGPLEDKRFVAAMVPWEMRPVYMSPMVREVDLVARMNEHFRRTYNPDDVFVWLAMKAYGVVLEEIYNIRLAFELPFSWVSFRDVESTVPIQCPVTRITRRFSIDFDTRFITAEVVGDRPEVSPEEIAPLVGDPTALTTLLKLLPPENFAFRGVSIMLAEDVTAEAALTAIRDDLLLKDALISKEGIRHIEEHVRSFMGRADLELGLIGFERGETAEAIVGGRAVGRSLLLSDGEAPECRTRARSVYFQAVKERRAVSIDDLEEVDQKTGFEYHLTGQGLRSLLVLPLVVEDSIIGLLELASQTPSALSAVNVFKLEEIQGLFALGLKRSMEDEEDRVQAIIKRDYTAIHPIVEWSFRRAARRRLQGELRGEPDAAEEIVFRDLVPLYGLTDIRSSSSLRNSAIVSDLGGQLKLARTVITIVQSARPQPALGELEFRLTRHIDSLHPQMATEDESSVLEFLQRHIEPLFDELVRHEPEVAPEVEAYRAAIDPQVGVLYDQRKRFEDSVSLMNEIVADALHEQDAHAQALAPHFFELFKTDGVDYNIYVGDALHESRQHDPLDVANLRLWQLMTMCRIDWVLQERRVDLPMPLDPTHLVLVQSTPLTIRFRRDEKRFDVDGAYDVRYEIVKKRIDKAVVRGTGERLTQPGMIAIAYSQEREAAEYRRYLDYLRSAGFVEDETEELELEDLQGVFGLRALRVTIGSVESRSAQEQDPTRELGAAIERLTTQSG